MQLNELLIKAKERDASDLHLNTGIPPVLRINGKLTRLDLPELTPEITHGMIYSILNEKQKNDFESFGELDLSYELVNISRFRVNIFKHRRGEGAAFRLIPEKVKTLSELGLPSILADFTEKDRGLVLITGPTGSGKSTTLAAMIDIINKNKHDNIITIEDPIEFIHSHKKCLISQREIGSHTQSFASALRNALREDPDVILVGEMRDLETISMALTAAETGHLVFSTLHTISASETIERIIDVFPPHQQNQVRMQLAGSLLGVVAQTLLPLSDEKGRVPALEIMVANPAIRNLIREGKAYQIPSTIQISKKDGMQSLDQSLKDLLMEGKISQEDAMKKAIDKKAFTERQY
ncbi:type IV pili twitching motility protein PilT [Candidatus Atribacteria bacterium RBG_19FT_COMBO_35_14]|uniref:Type IV pili twitching motility protein PilT n=1 Tax=Candidatus Sediminicultor quintus TaxID=1797291 RepID=A0A1F5A7J8_9BACT|nr:MAG: type IV pili twitching motility protein PilT [Candidatus Atribacteria bacterium RBG_19FT_COMBO_35_14]